MGLVFAIIVGLIVGLCGLLFFQKTYDLLLIYLLVGVGAAIIGDGLSLLVTANQEATWFSPIAIGLEIVTSITGVLLLALLQKAAPKNKDPHLPDDSK